MREGAPVRGGWGGIALWLMTIALTHNATGPPPLCRGAQHLSRPHRTVRVPLVCARRSDSEKREWPMTTKQGPSHSPAHKSTGQSLSPPLVIRCDTSPPPTGGGGGRS